MDKPENMGATFRRRVMSHDDFLNFGLNVVAYIRPVQIGSLPTAYSVHAANGEVMHIIENMADAQRMTRSHELIPQTVH